MRKQNKKTPALDEYGLPWIDPHRLYDTPEAATLLGREGQQLRQWRFRDEGPTYQQATTGGRVQYLGKWLIEFRAGSIKEPAV